MDRVKYRNQILNTLTADSIRRLDLNPIVFTAGQVLEFPGESVRYAYFIEEGLAAVTVKFQGISLFSVGLIGSEGMCGAAYLMGKRLVRHPVRIEIAGLGYFCKIECAHREFSLSGRFHHRVLHCVQSQLQQSMQLAACQTGHKVQERLASWLLDCSERIGDASMRLSNATLAEMLGVSRPAVTVAAKALKDARLISCRRGEINLLDPSGLQMVACECYSAIKTARHCP